MADPDLECVLAFCNDVRSTLGRQPVDRLRKGTRYEPQHCPVANTINHGCRNRVWVDSGSVDWGGDPPTGNPADDEIATPPQCVTQFIDAFDFHGLPDFEGEGWYGA